ncbi:hypothetical protein DYB26_012694 [Aphanomyces astaci]|uniref:Uncharacterized protein n=1 Tax=Aphanomyces astaci TaxID=112090 RepID=A0A397FTS1_APHAT|nr:hypothetical protein DYB26_012694 [Aphanomyces astaci]RHZ39853.1 hypothetical protein DYB31_016468 [Aphanomyces astaci]
MPIIVHDAVVLEEATSAASPEAGTVPETSAASSKAGVVPARRKQPKWIPSLRRRKSHKSLHGHSKLTLSLLATTILSLRRSKEETRS